MAADVVKVVDNGLAVTTDRLLDSPAGAEPKWIDMGTGVTPAADADTVLETPGPETRVVGVMTQETTTVTDDTLQVVGTITCDTGAKDITECGLFTHLSSTTGFLYLHATFDSIHLEIGNSIEFTIKVKYDQG